MHQISNVNIEGFWGTYNIDLKLFPEVTFLIGPNGTGKTTLINLLAAALTADFRTLDRMEFHKITINLKSLDDDKHSSIVVKKIKSKNKPIELIEYTVKNKENAEVKFSLEYIEEQFVLRQLQCDQRFIQQHYRRVSTGLLAALHELFHLSWLSVHRSAATDSRDDRVYDSPVDRKIDNQSNDLVRMFSTLSGQKDEEIRRFQQTIITSFLSTDEARNIFGSDVLTNLDKYDNDLRELFQELGIGDSEAVQKISTFIDKATRLRAKSSPKNKNFSMSLDDAVMLVSLQKISAIIKEWSNLQSRMTEIFSARDKWIEIGNQLFQIKTMVITPSNEVQFATRTGRNLTPKELSSGEKQLLILLSEALLQKQQPSIFIADEPEISLHVIWQERLVDRV